MMQSGCRRVDEFSDMAGFIGELSEPRHLASLQRSGGGPHTRVSEESPRHKPAVCLVGLPMCSEADLTCSTKTSSKQLVDQVLSLQLLSLPSSCVLSLCQSCCHMDLPCTTSGRYAAQSLSRVNHGYGSSESCLIWEEWCRRRCQRESRYACCSDSRNCRNSG